MLADPSPAEREVLGAIPYVRNEAVLHTDVRLLPRRRRAWASWNCHLLDEAVGRTTITYHMNRLQSLRADRELLVTLNLADRIDPATVIGEYSFDHPVYTRAGLAAQGRWAEISGVRRTHYCGAYWRWGFHEDGVWSALRACRALARREAQSSPHAGGGGVSASALYEGWVAHRRLAPVEHRFRYRDRDAAARPRRAAGRSRPPSRCGRRAGRRWCAGAARTSSAIPSCRWPRRPASLSASGSAPRPRGRCACSPGCASPGTPSTRSASCTCTGRAGRWRR